MDKKFKIIYDVGACIGAAACVAVSEKFWEIRENNKAHLKGSTKEGNIEILIINKKDLKENQEAAEVCPVGAIKIEEIKK